MNATGPNQRRVIFAASLALLSVWLVGLFYLWTAHASLGFNHLLHNKPHSINYDMLALGFLNGQVQLLEEPGPAILALEDPYDPEQNRATGPMYDASLYKGHHYLYFGAVPVLTFHLPYRLIFGELGSEPLGTWFFSILGFLAIAVFIFELWRLFAPTSNVAWVPLGILLIGLGNVFAFGQRGVQLYQTAIYCGVAWMMWTLVLLQRALAADREVAPGGARLLALWVGASFCSALAMGSRPTLIVSFVPVLLVFFLRHRRRLLEGPRRWLDRGFQREFAAAVVPWLLCLIAQGAYNYARFESVFEFGNRYTLNGQINVPKKAVYGAASAVPANLYLHLFRPIPFKAEFPWFSFDVFVPAWIPSPTVFYHLEPSGSLTAISPFSLFFWLGLIVLAMRWRRRPAAFGELRHSLGVFAAVALTGVLVLAEFLIMPLMAARYTVDYATYILVAAALLFFMIDQAVLTSKLGRWSWRAAGVLAAVLTVWIGFGISILGNGDNFRQENPRAYDRLASRFR
ncbi:MAG: hypothetical protein AAB425_03715 [Bdellovibrionota bacterium]